MRALPHETTVRTFLLLPLVATDSSFRVNQGPSYDVKSVYIKDRDTKKYDVRYRVFSD